MRTRRNSPGWTAWLEHMAGAAPGPLPIFFQAQLGFDAWWSAVVRPRLAAAVSRRPVAADLAIVAPRLLRVCLLLAVLGTAAGARAQLDTNAGAADLAGRGAPIEQGAESGLLASGGGEGPAGAQNEAGAVAGAQPAPGQTPGSPAAPGAAKPAAVERTIPARRGALPVGKGMWIWLHDRAEGGDVKAIVRRATDAGLTHVYVRTGTLKEGFMGAGFLDGLLPAAHAAGLRVYAWDFPYLNNVDGDVARAVAAIRHLTPDGHRVDGYVADVELRSMGVNITPATAGHFGGALRSAVGPNYPLIVSVPRPSPALVSYPYADLVKSFDAIAPMVYWLNRNPVADIAGAMRDLAPYGKPVIPVGQAYDGAAEGGPAGVPPRAQLIDFMRAGDQSGAAGVSWWSWQHATQEAWDAVRDAAEFRLPVGDGATFTAGQIRAYQTLLTSLGFPVAIDGNWGPAATAAVRAYQAEARLPVTGVMDDATREVLLTPFAPPLNG